MSATVAAIGSLAVVGLCVAVAAYATITYRHSKAIAGAVGAWDGSEPIDMYCGMRIGFMMASWPGGRFRLGPEGVAFDCSGRALLVAWSNVQLVELVKPAVPPIGWGLRFKLSEANTPTVVVLGIRRALAERLVEICGARGARTDQRPHFVLW
jgi:hypothetical protein